MLGLGREIASFGPLESLALGVQMQFESVQRIGDDIRVIARPIGRGSF